MIITSLHSVNSERNVHFKLDPILWPYIHGKMLFQRCMDRQGVCGGRANSFTPELATVNFHLHWPNSTSHPDTTFQQTFMLNP